MYDRNLESYHAERDELLNSNQYMEFVHKLDTQGAESYNLLKSAKPSSLEFQHQGAAKLNGTEPPRRQRNSRRSVAVNKFKTHTSKCRFASSMWHKINNVIIL